MPLNVRPTYSRELVPPLSAAPRRLPHLLARVGPAPCPMPLRVTPTYSRELVLPPPPRGGRHPVNHPVEGVTLRKFPATTGYSMGVSGNGEPLGEKVLRDSQALHAHASERGESRRAATPRTPRFNVVIGDPHPALPASTGPE